MWSRPGLASRCPLLTSLPQAGGLIPPRAREACVAGPSQGYYVRAALAEGVKH